MFKSNWRRWRHKKKRRLEDLKTQERLKKRKDWRKERFKEKRVSRNEERKNDEDFEEKSMRGEHTIEEVPF